MHSRAQSVTLKRGVNINYHGQLSGSAKPKRKIGFTAEEQHAEYVVN